MLITDVDKEKLSPMMKFYVDTKEQYKDCILFYRLGDFYEMFFEDAIVAARELELALTGKSCGLPERAPMCGIPYHACDRFIDRLVLAGHKVAICEQVEDPKLAKGLVKREVVRIVTPGTNLSDSVMSSQGNNYLMAVSYTGNNIGISVADITTGDYFLTEVDSLRELWDEIYKYSPAEIICNDAFILSGDTADEIKEKLGIFITAMNPAYYDEERCKNKIAAHFHTNGIAGLGLSDFPNGIIAAGVLLQYLYETQKNNLDNIFHLYPYISSTYMLLDGSTRRNLELTETLREKQKKGSLCWVLDKTKTAMGARRLNSMLKQPLIVMEDIEARLDAVEMLYNNPMERDELREYLSSVYDLERLMGKLSNGSANPRDMLALKSSLEYLEPVAAILKELNSPPLNSLLEELDTLGDVYTLIDEAISEDAPTTQKEGGIIKSGYSDKVDMLKRARTEGKQWILDYELSQQEETGIKNLHIKYNKVFGYYIEISNSAKDKAPASYIRKQTLTNGERFTTDKLKELEEIILGSNDELYAKEYEIYSEIKAYISGCMERILKTAGAIAGLDVFCSLAYVAQTNNFVRPKLNTKGIIKIKDGRHPVVEKMISNDLFVSNDTLLDNKKNLVSIITGPNMAGKSTYMRQVALIVLMAQIGSFVPALSADIGIVDRIFTRVGASDDLASGQSTFMIEMNEVANILRNATSNSLVILDEIGRGTSTFDGLGIAWAVVEHIANPRIIGAKTLFATHYHELTELEEKMPNVNNYCIAVKEQGEDVVFLRKIVKGGADKSYGIQVARLAGVPDMVLGRAREIVDQLVDNDIIDKIQSIASPGQDRAARRKAVHYDQVDLTQMSLYAVDDDETLLKELKELDISNLTPLDALNTLYKFQSRLNNRWSGD